MALSAGPAPVSETVLLSILYPPCCFVNERTSVYANGINNDFLMKKSNSRDMFCYYFPDFKEEASAIARSLPARRLISAASDAGT